MAASSPFLAFTNPGRANGSGGNLGRGRGGRAHVGGGGAGALRSGIEREPVSAREGAERFESWSVPLVSAGRPRGSGRSGSEPFRIVKELGTFAHGGARKAAAS